MPISSVIFSINQIAYKEHSHRNAAVLRLIRETIQGIIFRSILCQLETELKKLTESYLSDPLQ
jgi:hypothetical protein